MNHFSISTLFHIPSYLPTIATSPTLKFPTPTLNNPTLTFPMEKKKREGKKDIPMFFVNGKWMNRKNMKRNRQVLLDVMTGNKVNEDDLNQLDALNQLQTEKTLLQHENTRLETVIHAHPIFFALLHLFVLVVDFFSFSFVVIGFFLCSFRSLPVPPVRLPSLEKEAAALSRIVKTQAKKQRKLNPVCMPHLT